jgi:hypothetical protein
MEISAHPRKTRKPRNKSTYGVGRAVHAFYRALNQPASCFPLARTARPTPIPPENENPVLYPFKYFRAFRVFRGRTAVPQNSVIYA